MMEVYKHWSHYPVGNWRWPNFRREEVACKNGPGRSPGTLAIHEETMDKLQLLRERLGKPMIITSAYRTPKYNQRVGGVHSSMHLKARAFDVSMRNHDPHEFEAAARAVGFTGFGFYPSMGFMHIDTGDDREWGTRWPKQVTQFDDPEIKTETESKSRGTVGGVVASVGAATAATNSLGGLEGYVQAIAIGGLLVGVVALAWVFREEIKALISGDDV